MRAQRDRAGDQRLPDDGGHRRLGPRTVADGPWLGLRPQGWARPRPARDGIERQRDRVGIPVGARLTGLVSDGSRRVTSITEVTGMEGEIITIQDIFVFEKRGLSPEGKVLGRFAATGIRPKFYEKLLAAGIRLRPDLFDEVEEV